MFYLSTAILNWIMKSATEKGESIIGMTSENVPNFRIEIAPTSLIQIHICKQIFLNQVTGYNIVVINCPSFG